MDGEVPSTKLNEGEVKKKKKKKKKAPKEERRKAREAEQLNAIYSPKDTHVKLVSQKALSQLRSSLQGPEQMKSVKLSQLAPGLFSSNESFPSLHQLSSNEDFSDLFSNSLNNVGISLPKTKNSSRVLKSVSEGPMNENEEKPTKDIQVPTSSKSVEEVQNQIPTGSKRKARRPVVINIDDLLNESKKKAEEKKKLDARNNTWLKVGIPNAKSISVHGLENMNITGGNLLDSSGPVTMKRGKIRKKKEKKPSKLKKAILISRTVRQISKTLTKSDCINTPIETDDKEVVGDQMEASEITQIDSNDFIDSQLVLEQFVNPYFIDEIEPNWIPPIPFVPLVPTEFVTPFLKLPGIDSPNYANNAIPLFDNIGNCNYKPFGPIEFIPLQSPEVQVGQELAITPGACEGAFSSENQNDVGETEEEKITKLFNTSLKVEESAKEEISSKISQQPEIPLTLFEVVKDKMHTKKFRKYCDMYCSKELHGHVINLLKELHRFQDRIYKTDPMKLKTKRRYVHGLKDVASYLEFNKVCLVIIAPNIEQNSVKGGLDDKLREIMNLAQERKVPCIFSGNRFFLGKPIMLKTPVSIIAIVDKHGAEEHFHLVLEEADKLRIRYNEDFNKLLVQHSTSFA